MHSASILGWFASRVAIRSSSRCVCRAARSVWLLCVLLLMHDMMLSCSFEMLLREFFTSLSDPNSVVSSMQCSHSMCGCSASSCDARSRSCMSSCARKAEHGRTLCDFSEVRSCGAVRLARGFAARASEGRKPVRFRYSRDTAQVSDLLSIWIAMAAFARPGLNPDGGIRCFRGRLLPSFIIDVIHEPSAERCSAEPPYGRLHF